MTNGNVPDVPIPPTRPLPSPPPKFTGPGTPDPTDDGMSPPGPKPKGVRR